ncbi:MAG TPA: choice-of-anchor M domain-containing protein, partial [Solirubrobacteraceae bacterium]|nr:choice-of-anchor M domain-containing protein [Solirubrobacteraceae bacterium]
MTRLAFVLAAVLLAAVTAPASAADLPLSERHVMSVGHADVINVRPEDGRLLVDVTDDSGDEPVQRRPGDVLLHAKPESQLTVPDDPAYAFLGAPDDPVWIMPEVQDNGLLWPGWNTMAVSATEFPDAMLTMRLLDLRGPDELSVFTSGPMGEPNIIFDTGHPLPQAAPIFNRSHTHVNWAFEAEGVYRMTVEVLGVRADGQTVSTGPITYTWFVGDLADLPPDVPPPGPDAPPGPEAPPVTDGAPPPPTPSGTGTGPEPVALRARVSGSRLRLGAVRRAGALRLRCRLDGAGTCAARASIAAA